MKRLKSLAFVYASIFSLLIGLGAGIFLTISSELISLFWSKLTLTHPGLLLLQCLLSSYLLWSGAFTMWDLVDQAAKLGPVFLISLAFGKCLLTNFGFGLGWRGGTIFPAIFCSVALGMCLDRGQRERDRGQAETGGPVAGLFVYPSPGSGDYLGLSFV